MKKKQKTQHEDIFKRQQTYLIDQKIRLMKEEERLKILNEKVIKQELREPIDIDSDILKNFMQNKESNERHFIQKKTDSVVSKSSTVIKNSKQFLRTMPNYEKLVKDFENKQQKKQGSQDNSSWQRLYNAQKDHIKMSQIWPQQNQDKNIYEFSNEDKTNSYFQGLIQQIHPDWISKQECQIAMTVKFYENLSKGNKYFQIYTSRWVNSNLVEQDCLIISSQIFQFCELQQEFVLQNEFLLDIFYGFSSVKDHAQVEELEESYFHMLFQVLSLGEKSYYFLKKEEKNQDGQNLKILQFFENTLKPKFIDIIGLKQSKANRIIESIQEYDIVLPQDLQHELGDLDIGFLKDATFGASMSQQIEDVNFLEKQYLLVQTWKESSTLLVCSLQNTKEPVLRFENSEFERIECGFFTRIDNQIIFSLKSKYIDYQIEIIKQNVFECEQTSRNNSPRQNLEDQEAPGLGEKKNSSYQIQEDKRIKIYQCKTMKITANQDWKSNYDVLHIGIEQFGKIYDQSYYMTKEGLINLIYPIFEENDNPHPASEEDNSYIENKIIQQISEKHEIDLEHRQYFTLLFDNQRNFQNYEDHVLEYLQQIGFTQSHYSCIVCLNDLIFAYDDDTKFIEIASFKKNKPTFSFNKTLEDCKSVPESFLFKKLMNNFDWSFDDQKKIYQDNYKYNHRDNRQKRTYINNEYIKSYYINKRRKNVFQTHNEVYVNSREFSFDEKQLLIDLSESKDQKDPFKLLNLYSNDFKKIKLLKYHLSDNVAIFFFIYRSDEYINQNKKIEKSTESYIYGVHFFLIIPIQQLRLLIISKKCLIQSGTTVFIPMELDNIIKEKFDDKTIVKYLGSHQFAIRSSNGMCFEMVSDLGAPVNQWFPYIYNSSLCFEYMFENYLCFFNIEDMLDKLSYIESEDEDIDFSKYIQDFKIEYYQQYQENSNLKDIKIEQHLFRNQIPSLIFGRHQNMFSRISNWQRNIQNTQKDYDSFSAKFQIGTNIYYGKELQQIEIRDILVTIKRGKNNQDRVNALPIQLQHATFSQEYLKKIYCNMNDFPPGEDWGYSKVPLENNYLIPDIDDDGNIKSSYALINYFQTHNGAYQIINDLESIKDQISIKNYKTLKQKNGQYIFLTKKRKSTFEGYFYDGTYIEDMDYSVLQEFQIYKDSNANISEKILEDQFLNQYRQPHFLYDVFHLDDQVEADDLINMIDAPYSKMRIKTLYHKDNFQQQIYICSSKFDKNCILQEFFDRNESLNELYEFQRFMFCISINDFKEVFAIHHTKSIQRYFQPRFIFNGQSICSIELEYSISQVNEFSDSLFSQKKVTQPFYLENSIFDLATQNISIDIQKTFIESLQINQYFQLYSDFTQCQSIIQKAIEQQKDKYVNILLDFSYENQGRDYAFWLTINQNIPQLLSTAKFDLNNFFNLSAEEEEMQSKYLSDHLFINFEFKVVDDNLSQLGEKQLNSYYIKNSNSPFGNVIKIQEQFVELNNKYHENQHMMDQQHFVNVDHSILNFEPMIRKMKIDAILNRSQDESNFTQYMSVTLNSAIKDIKYIDHLFLAQLVFKNIDTHQFLNQNTIKSLIDIQFAQTEQTVQQIILLYLIGFYIPFIYNTICLNYNFVATEEEDNHIIFVKFLYLIMAYTQASFLLFEYAEIKYNGLENYFQDGWNYADFSQPFIFLFLMFTKFLNIKLQKFGFQKLFMQVLQILILIQATIKMLQYIRFDEKYCFLVDMLTQVLFDLKPFITIFLIFVFVFSLIIIIMEADGNTDGGDYLDMSPFTRILMQSFRISIGDVQINQYGKWGQKEGDQDFKSAQPYAETIIWFFWICNLVFMLIIMLNFLIAEVSATYEKVKSQGENSIYKQKVTFNKSILQVKSLFGRREFFKYIAVEKPCSEQTKRDDFSSITDQVKKNSAEQLKKLKKKLLKENSKLVQFLDEQSQQIFQINQKMEDVQNIIHGKKNSSQQNPDEIMQILMNQGQQMGNIEQKNDQICQDFQGLDKKLDDLVILFLKMAEHLSQIPPYQEEGIDLRK